MRITMFFIKNSILGLQKYNRRKKKLVKKIHRQVEDFQHGD